MCSSDLQFTFPPTVQEGSLLSTPSPAFTVCRFFCLLILLNLLCLGSPFCRLQVCSSCSFRCLSPVAKVGSVGCVGFLVEGTSVCVWWMMLDLVFLVFRSMSGGVFWGVCGLITVLGILSPNGWGFIPVLLVVWHRVSSTVACWSLSEAGSWH